MEVLQIWERDMATKNSIRKFVLEVRNDISRDNQETWSRKISEQFFSLEELSQMEVIFLYAGYGSEVLTQETIEALIMLGKHVALPRVHGDTMDFYEISGLDELESGFHGIMEPINNKKTVLTPDLIVMPGVAFDESRNRIGYGRGYYDRYLKKYPDVPRIAFSFECQIVDQIPYEPSDIRPDTIITEYRMIR